ncbi:MAG: linear amide C-N hydrolase, partial [Deltaproteobacteria bacterium]
MIAAMAGPAWPCTTFLIAGKRHVVGKNYDYHVGFGQVVVNRRGLEKHSVPFAPGARTLRWTSRYSSVTFNQYGLEFPNGGMNEKGLVVEIMWLYESRYPAPGKRPVVNELQWVQYLLDTCSNVDEAISRAREVDLVPVYAKVHYLACDRTGRCAAFEYLDGKLVITPPDKMVVNVLTNSTHADSVSSLRNHRGFGGWRPVPQDAGSLSRFVRAAWLARQSGGDDPVARSFAILASVAIPGENRWRIVYDLDNLSLHFKTDERVEVKSLPLAKLVDSCRQPAMVADMNAAAAGDISGLLRPATRKAELDLLERSLAHLAGKLPPGTGR